jgi:pimeloyl-ACP methyl ester carboxylesterase
MTGHDFDASGAIVPTAVPTRRRMRAMADPHTFVLVHGAWHGAWCWDEVAARLRADGAPVVAVELPSVASGGDMYDDAAAVHDAIAAVDGEAIVVGHSYGGVVITEGAAGLPGVRHLVYVTAFMLDQGESLLDMVGGALPFWVVPANEGRGMIAIDGERVFYNTTAPEAARAATARLRPQAKATFEQPVRSVAWRDVPSTYVICDRDNAIPVPVQEAMAARAGTVHRLDCDHSPFLNDPDAVAALIREAAALPQEH